MRALILSFALAAVMCAQSDRPLAALPYTPSLDTAFIDRTADPCTDFYRYACGNWNKLNPIPPDQARWDVYSKLANENQRFLWGILEEAARPTAGRDANQQKIGDYFTACMDEAAIEKSGAAPLRSRLEEIERLTSKAQLPKLLAAMHLDAAGGMVRFSSAQDFADSSRQIAYAGAGGLGLPDRDYYTKTDAKSVETRARYVAHVETMFGLLGDPAAQAARAAATVMEIETALAKSMLTRTQRRDPYKLYHRFTRDELLTLTPAFGWSDYFAAAGVPGLKEFNVTEPAFYKQLEQLLETRNLADWKAYLRWHLVHAKARYLSSRFVAADFDFYSRYLYGVREMQPRWKRCVRMVDRDLGEALGQEFVRKTFSADTKARALAMTREIQQAMEGEIRELTWMGDETRQRALEKLHAVVDKIGYPDHWRDYSGLTIARGDFYANVERAARFESKRQLGKIGKPVDRGEWRMTPPTVNAYYSPQMNDINFPAGVLQPPLYDPKLDDAPNYGNTGATIGHELTHGFDDEGRKFDAHGNLHDWWTKADAAEFERRASCISDQYGQYTVVDEIKLNSKLTLGEDTADLGGTLLAYLAWKHATRGQELKPVDGFTPDQRFFIGMAQWACGYERPEVKRAGAITNPHSPDEDRINGVVVNLPEFGAAFACKVGQPMMKPPDKVCKVW